MKPHIWRRTHIGKYLRHAPRPKHLRGSWLHRKIGDSLLHHDLWHPEPKTIAGGFAIGAFWSMIPMPFQMIPSILCAFFLKRNIAASIVGVWLTNPITIPPIFYLQFKFASTLFDLSVIEWKNPHDLLLLLEKAPLILLSTSVLWGLATAAIAYPFAYFGWKWLTNFLHRSHCHSRKRKNKLTPISLTKKTQPLDESNAHPFAQSTPSAAHSGGGSRNRTDA